MANIRTHYDNLKVARDAPASVIKEAYEALYQSYYPDRYEGNKEDAEKILKLIKASYEVLIDPVLRAKHDAWIRKQESIPPAPASHDAWTQWQKNNLIRNQESISRTQPSYDAWTQGQKNTLTTSPSDVNFSKLVIPIITGLLFCIGVLIGSAVIAAGAFSWMMIRHYSQKPPEQNKATKQQLSEQQAKKKLAIQQQAKEQLAKEQMIKNLGAINSALICPHCQTKGKVHTKSVVLKKGVSGTKAAAALFTGGLSLLVMGLSWKENHTQAHCDECNSTWIF